MNNKLEQTLKSDEKASFTLRGIYEEYGYGQFRMGKFEEYDLYAANKDFLQSDSIITFTDTNGKLMALKPDVTLSIIKNVNDCCDSLQKLYYDETVYRISKDTRTYKELLQVGVECIGDIDLYQETEVILLACKSLEAIDSDYILALSHMGIINLLVDGFNFTGEQKDLLFKFIGEKNLHGIENLCEINGVNPVLWGQLISLLSCYGSSDTVIEKLQDFNFSHKISEYISELEKICMFLSSSGIAHIQMDFSIVNHMNYYNGIVFQGFISGIPSAVISGGRYDRLLEKMGKYCGGIGFAFYMNLLEYLESSITDFDTDVLLLYDEDSEISQIIKCTEDLIASGLNVQTQKNIPKKLKYKELMMIKNGRLESLEKND